MSSKRTYITLFGKEFRIEYTESNSFDFGIKYTNQSYNDEHQLYLAFIRRIWISRTNYNGRATPVRYGFTIDRHRLTIYYGVCDHFEEIPGAKVWNFSWSRINDFFFGREKFYHTDDKEHGKFPMKLDHGDEYNVSITSCERIVSRGRFITHRWRSYECTPDRGVPHQGKGENSWDCGDNATFSMSCSGNSPEEVLKKFNEGCERDRRKYGMVCDPQMYPDKGSDTIKDIAQAAQVSLPI